VDFAGPQLDERKFPGISDQKECGDEFQPADVDEGFLGDWN